MYGYQFQTRLTPISGNGARPSLFGETVQNSVTFHPNMGAARVFLGQSTQEWYQRAQKSLAEFDALLKRVAQVANKTAREQILEWIGTADDEDRAAYRYSRVKSDLEHDVEAFTPPNINAYQVERRTRRIEKLEDFNRELNAMVSEAETVYGKLPEPVTIERTRIVEGKTDWTLPLIVAGGAVAVAVGIALFK